jgi:hypothetical protein
MAFDGDLDGDNVCYGSNIRNGGERKQSNTLGIKKKWR